MRDGLQSGQADHHVVAEVLRQSLQGAQIVRIEHTADTRKRRRNREGEELIAGHMEADRLRRNLVVANRHNGAPRTGANQILNNEEREQQEDDAGKEGREPRRAGDALRTLN